MQQMYVPPLSKINKTIIIIYVVCFLASSVLSQNTGTSLVPILGLSIEGLSSGYVFQLITFPFIDTGFMSVLFNALILWFIGSELENKWGSKFYLKFLGISAYSAGLFYLGIFALIGSPVIPLYGLTGANLVLFVAYALIYSERTLIFMFVFPMKAKYFCMLLAGIEIYMGIFTRGGAGAWCHLFSMGVGFLYLKVKSLQARGVTLSALKEEHHRNKMRQKLKLVKEEEETPPDKPDPDKPKYWQ